MDYDAERRRILLQVADGTMTPEEAADRLAVLEEAAATRPEPAWRGPGAGEPTYREGPEEVAAAADGTRATRIRVTASIRSVQIVGDPTVHEVAAEGRHEARREGTTIVIDGDPSWSWEEDSELDDERPGFRFARVGGRRIYVNNRSLAAAPPLRIRMNPALALDAVVQAGAMTVRDVPGPIKAEVDAGTLRMRGFDAPITVDVNAGNFSARGRLRAGESRVTCNAGKVDVQLEEGSSVRISGQADLGRISLPGGAARKGGLLSSRSEAVVGDGEGSLRLSVSVGAATVRSVEWDGDDGTFEDGGAFDEGAFGEEMLGGDGAFGERDEG